MIECGSKPTDRKLNATELAAAAAAAAAAEAAEAGAASSAGAIAWK